MNNAVNYEHIAFCFISSGATSLFHCIVPYHLATDDLVHSEECVLTLLPGHSTGMQVM